MLKNGFDNWTAIRPKVHGAKAKHRECVYARRDKDGRISICISPDIKKKYRLFGSNRPFDIKYNGETTFAIIVGDGPYTLTNNTIRGLGGEGAKDISSIIGGEWINNCREFETICFGPDVILFGITPKEMGV